MREADSGSAKADSPVFEVGSSDAMSGKESPLSVALESELLFSSKEESELEDNGATTKSSLVLEESHVAVNAPPITRNRMTAAIAPLVFEENKVFFERGHNHFVCSNRNRYLNLSIAY